MHSVEITEKCTGRDLGDGHRTVLGVGGRSSLRRGVQGLKPRVWITTAVFLKFQLNQNPVKGSLTLRL